MTASTLPVLLGTSIAFSNESVFNAWYFILAFIGGICMHIGANVINDYFDYKGGSDNINVEFIRPFTGLNFGILMILGYLLAASPQDTWLTFLILVVVGGLLMFKISEGLEKAGDAPPPPAKAEA